MCTLLLCKWNIYKIKTYYKVLKIHIGGLNMKKDNESLLDFTYDVKSESNDISKVKCVGILADKIYDYTSFETLQFGLKNE